MKPPVPTRPSRDDGPPAATTPLTRRAVLALVGLGLGAVGCSGNGVSYRNRTFRHYKELTPKDKERLLRRLEAETLARTGVRVTIEDPPPLEGVKFAFALDLSACIGCRRCVEACARENDLPDRPAHRYIRVLERPRGKPGFHHARLHYEGTVPDRDKQYLPVQCQQCENPPCVTVCPCGATWQEPDGIVVVDYEWCLGCRYCLAACPYDARRFNFDEPDLPPDEINPRQGLLSNRRRPVGVAEKCTFCLHRARQERYPACVEACPTGARHFGDLNDPAGAIRRVIDEKPVVVLAEQLGTMPRFYYYFG